MKDHEIATLVNDLRDIALKYHGAQSLREMIRGRVVPVIYRLNQEIKDWEEAGGFTAVMRDEFAGALVEIEMEIQKLKEHFDFGPIDDFFVRERTNRILAACAGSIGKTASPADTVSELDRANTGLAQESLDLQIAALVNDLHVLDERTLGRVVEAFGNLNAEIGELRIALEKISVTASLIQVDPPATAEQLETQLDAIADFADQVLERFQLPDTGEDQFL